MGSKMVSIWKALKDMVYGGEVRGAGKAVWRVECWNEMRVGKIGTESKNSECYIFKLH